MENSGCVKQKNRRRRVISPALDVGSRIRRFREARKLTLRALADRCSLSVNAISLIERGKNSPTVSSLHALADALGVGIVEFFQDGEMHDSVYVDSNHRLSHSKDGLLMESLGIGLQNQQIEPFMITLEPGSGGKELICHPGQEFAYCLSGEVDFQVEANTYHLKAGDSLLLEATREHVFRNNGPDSACFLIVFQAVGDSNIASRLHF